MFSLLEIFKEKVILIGAQFIMAGEGKSRKAISVLRRVSSGLVEFVNICVIFAMKNLKKSVRLKTD